jgi:hypothetical protein
MVGDVFSLATLLTTFVAVAVALLAYQGSTGLPNLELIILFYGEENTHVMNYTTSAKRWAELGKWFGAPNDDSIAELEVDRDGWKKVAYIWIHNKSKYSAHNPAVIVRFGDIHHPTLGLCKSWKSKDDPPWRSPSLTRSGMVVVETQWDGDYPIHGGTTRRLPDLHLETLFSTDITRPAVFYIDLLADGYKRPVKMIMNFIVEAEQGEQQQAVD